MANSEQQNKTIEELKGLLNPPNPFKVLGLSREVVRSLASNQALLIAARGMYQAMLHATHPDQAGSKKAPASRSILDLQNAMQAIKANPEAVRRSYLSEGSQRSAKQTLPPQAAKEYTDRTENRKNREAALAAIRRMVDGFYDPEAVTNINRASLFVRTYSIYPAEKINSCSIEIANGKATYRPMKLFDSVQPPDVRVRELAASIGLPISNGTFGLYGLEDDTLIIDPDNNFHLSGALGEHMEPFKWYQLRGNASGDKGDVRSVQFYDYSGTSEDLSILGSISMEAARLMQNSSVRVGRSSGKQVVHEELKAGSNMEIPKWLGYSYVLDAHFWNTLISGEGASRDLTFSPKINPGEVLVGETKDYRVMLGTVEHGAIEYH